MKTGTTDAIEIIKGKEYKPWHFKPGNKAASINKGQAKASTIKAQALTIIDRKQFKIWVNTYGLTRIMAIMETMNDTDFLKAIFQVMPYCLPKLASVQYRDEEDNIHSIAGNLSNHTITIKDMNNGTIAVIEDY